MIGKNLLTVLIAVVVLCAAFFGYHHFTKSKDLEAHHEDTYRHLTAAAKKNPQVGLAQMGRAINKYYAENKSYPTNLDTLYPKYMNSKSFINDINWSYRPTGNNFLLSKSTILGNRTVVASTNKGLNVRMGASTTVAFVDRKSTVASATTTPDRTAELKPGTALKTSAEDMPSKPHSPLGLPPTAEAPAEKTEKAKEPEDIALSKSQIQTIVIDESETPSGLVSELSNSYLVWKDEHGYLGFGNVQYPRIDGLSIATPYNWFNVNRPFEEEASDTQEIMASKNEIDIEASASYFSEQYLVWKDKNGNIGFGNTQYPVTEDIEYVNIDGEWFKFKR